MFSLKKKLRPVSYFTPEGAIAIAAVFGLQDVIAEQLRHDPLTPDEVLQDNDLFPYALFRDPKKFPA